MWSYLHIITLIPTCVVMILSGIILKKYLINKAFEIKMIPVKICAILLIVGEIFKQIISIKNGYDLFHLPFHVCSLFVFFIPLMAFYKGKYSNQINSITITLCTILLICMIIMPNQIYSSTSISNFFNNYFSFHTVVFHNIIIFILILIMLLELYTPKYFTSYKIIFMFGCIYVLIASTAAQLLKTNYSNFYYCQIPMLQNISDFMTQQLGNIGGILMHILMVGSTHIAGFLLSYLLVRMSIIKLKKQ